MYEITAVDGADGSERWATGLHTRSVGTPAPGHVLTVGVEGVGPDIGFRVVVDGETLAIGMSGSTAGEGPAREDIGITVPLLGVPPTFQLDVIADHAGGSTLLGTIRGRRSWWEAPPTGDALEALFLVTLGRTGSSAVMHLLRCVQGIVMYPEWPYELQATRRWASGAIDVLAHPHGSNASGDFRADPPTGLWRGRRNPWADSAPMQAWYADGYFDSTARWATESVRRFYEHVARTIEAGPVAYFAEKHLPYQQSRAAHELFPHAKKIVLVRDFRSMVASMRAFDEKRGSSGFGRVKYRSDAEFIEVWIAETTSKLVRFARENPDALLLRYEDLVADPVAETLRILTHLEFDADRAAANAIVELWQTPTEDTVRHRTSDDDASSVDRWRTDLSDELQALCDEHLGEALREFGYA